jgi:hypothetical protein
VINAIDLESFTFQSSYRISVLNDKQVKALIAGSGGVFYEDYTGGQRFGMGALNMFFGLGSIANRHHIGWVTTGFEVAGLPCLIIGLAGFRPYWSDYEIADSDLSEYSRQQRIERNERIAERKKRFIIAGSATIGAGVLFGFVIPFFHHKPNNTVSQNNFPFNLELVSSDNQEINGFRVLYKMKF